MTAQETYYMCDRNATSREHVPPQCFFPGSKESFSGKDLRRNLITVPSCDFHNSKKSRDDLYLLHVISFTYQINQEGQHLFAARIRKTIESRPYLLKTFFNQTERAFINDQPTLAIAIDIPRFENGMTCIANAIYFAHFQKKWNEPVEILSPSLRFPKTVPRYKEGNTYLATQVEPFDGGAEKYGENQEIFFYQFIDGDLPEHKLLRMVFYQGFVVLAVPLKRKEYLHNKRA